MDRKKRTIAIITARGGSKRIPGKNIREFCGRPIISYSIQTALESGIFDEVMVSTDSKEIAVIAKNYGAEVPFMRSAETSNDMATTRDVLLEVLTEYQKLGRAFEYMCCLYPTAPFVTAEKLKQAYKKIRETGASQVMPVVEFSFPPQRCNVLNEEGMLEYRFPEYRQTRSQDLETWYHDAGQFYMYNVEKYLQEDGMPANMVPVIVSEMEVQDIDSETDWKLAELKYQLMLNTKLDKDR